MLEEYNFDEYQSLLNDFKTNQLPNITDLNDNFFKKYKISITFNDVQGLLLDQSRLVNENVMALFINHMIDIAKEKHKKWIIDFEGYNIIQQQQNIQLNPIKNIHQGFLPDQTHYFIIYHFKQAWFAALYEISSKKCSVFSPQKKYKEDSLKYAEAIFMEQINEKPVEIMSAIEGAEGGEESDVVLLLQLINQMVLREDLNYLKNLSQKDIDSFRIVHLVDWLILKLWKQSDKTIHSFQHFSQHKPPPKRPSQVASEAFAQQENSQSRSKPQNGPQIENKPIEFKRKPDQSYTHLLDYFNNTAQTIRDQQRQNQEPIQQDSTINKSINQNNKSSQLKSGLSGGQVFKFGQPQQPSNFEEQIKKEQFLEFLESLRSEVLNEMNNREYSKPVQFLRNRIDDFQGHIEEYPNGQQILNFRINELDQIMKEYVTSNQTGGYNSQQPQPIEGYLEMQQALQFYYQNDPQQYYKLIDTYTKNLHESVSLIKLMVYQIFAKMGLTKREDVQLPQKKTINVSQSTFISRKPEKISQPHAVGFLNQSQLKTKPEGVVSSEVIVAKRYQRDISMREFELLKIKMTLSETILNFFFKYLDEKQEYFKEEIVSEYHVFYMSTNFYRALTIQGGHGTCNYEVTIIDICQIY